MVSISPKASLPSLKLKGASSRRMSPDTVVLPLAEESSGSYSACSNCQLESGISSFYSLTASA